MMSKFCYIYLIKIKDESFSKFIVYKTKVQNQLERTIKIINYDRGGESSNQLVQYCEMNDIIHEETTPYSSQSNGTFINMIKCMLSSFGLLEQ
jgi:hypothetical protein